MSKLLWIVMMSLVGGVIGCSSSSGGTEEDGGDTANESATGGDGDTDADSDTDTEIETNTDSDTKPETGTEYADCEGAEPIDCGDQLSGTTVGGSPNEWGAYNCSAQGYSGPESLYVFVPDDDYEVEARLSGLSVDLALFLVPECERMDFFANATHCTYRSGSSTDEVSFRFTAQAGETLVFIVDGLDDAEGSYTLWLECTS